MFKKSALTTAITAVLFSNASLAVEQYDAVIVTATRFATTIDAAAVNMTVITRETIEASASHDLAQLFETQANIFVSDLYGIGANKTRVDLGGFGAAGSHNTLILLNGRRLNDVDLSGANLAAIPLEDVERVEIIRGSSTVLYGDNATAGVINIVTRNGFTEMPERVGVELGSYHTRALNLSAGKAFEDIALSAQARTARSDGYRDNSTFENRAAIAELSRQFDAALFGVRINASKEDLELPGELNEPLYEADPTASTATLEFAEQQETSVEGYWQSDVFSAELAWRKKSQQATVYGDTEADLTTYSFTPRLKHLLGRHQLIAGIDLYQSELDTFADFSTSGPFINSSLAQRDSYAVYATDRIKLGAGTDLDIGARRQHVALDIGNVDHTTSAATSAERADDLTAWDISLRHALDENVHAYARLAQSFRFPVLDEMWSYFYGTISPLKPQTGRHLEVGANMALSKASTLAIDAFNIKLEDEIAFDASSYSNVNLDQTRHHGLNVTLNSAIDPRWRLAAGFALRKAFFTAGPNEGRLVPEIPQRRLTLSNQVKVGDNGMLGLDAIFTGKRYFGDDVTNAGKQMPSHRRLNLSYKHTIKSFELGLQVDNLTDEQAADAGYYRSWSSNPYYYYPLPGRSYYLSLATRF